MARRSVSSDPIARAVSLHADAARLRGAGEHRVALAAALRALALFERHEGRRHPDVAAALLEVGAALELHDRWTEALRQYQRAERLLARYARLRDPDIRRLRVKTQRALAGVLRALGRYDEADVHARRAVALATQWFGPRDLDLAGALNDLGMLRKYQGRYDGGAAAVPARAGDPARRRAWRESADAASLHHNLGGIEHARGRYASAEAPARRAVVLRTRALGAGHPVVAADVAALAAIVEGRGRLAEAARLYARALDVFRRVFGARCYEVGVNLAGLAGVDAARGRHAEAEARLPARAGDPHALVRRPTRRGRADAEQSRDRGWRPRPAGGGAADRTARPRLVPRRLRAGPPEHARVHREPGALVAR